MTIEIQTKYSIGDRIFVLHNGNIINPLIQNISLWITKKNKIEVSYIVDEPYTGGSFGENKVFRTKQDLINSL